MNKTTSSIRRKAVAGTAVVGGVTLVAVGLSACGGAGNTVSGNTLDVYSSMPLQGASSKQAVVAGEALALQQAGGKAGQFTIHLKAVDDSTTALANYDEGQCASGAEVAAHDPLAIGYIGEYNSGCTEVSLPILNEAGIAMISPGNTYDGLTTKDAGTAPGEPGKYYPTGERNYVRLVPRDSVQAAADLQAIKDSGCKRVAIANDGTPYGKGITDQIELGKASYGVNVVSDQSVNPYAATYAPEAAKMAAQGADCFFYGGLTSTGGVKIFDDVHNAIPTAQLFGPDGMANSSLAGGVPQSMDHLITTTAPALDPSSFPGGQAFLDAYQAKYGVANPDPFAVYGYESMKLLLDTISKLGAQGNDRAAVINALLHTTNRQSPIGTYSINPQTGDTTSTAYGEYKVKNGQLQYARALRPQHAIGS